jgi:hypothetical protein
MVWVVFILITIIIGRMIQRWFFAPFGADELSITLKILRDGMRALAVGNPDIHPASGLLTWSFFQFFSPPRFDARMVGALPAVVFSILCLLYLRKTASKKLPLALQCLCFVPFLVNPVFLYHSTSLKGYSLMMLAGLVLLNLWEIPAVIIVAFGPLVHAFLGLMAISSVIAQCLCHDRIKRLLKWELLALVPSLFFLSLQVLALVRKHELGVGFVKRYSRASLLPYTAGIQNYTVGLIFVAFLLSVAIFNIWSRRRDYLTLWIFTFSHLFAALYFIFRPSFLAGRFFLGLFPLLVLWSLDTINKMERGMIKASALLAFVLLFCVAPLFSTEEITKNDGDGLVKLAIYEDFGRRTLHVTEGSSAECFEFQGLPVKVDFLRELYLSRNPQNACPELYRVSLGVASRSFPKFSDLSDWEEILHDASGNILYRKKRLHS